MNQDQLKDALRDLLQQADSAPLPAPDSVTASSAVAQVLSAALPQLVYAFSASDRRKASREARALALSASAERLAEAARWAIEAAKYPKADLRDLLATMLTDAYESFCVRKMDLMAVDDAVVHDVPFVEGCPECGDEPKAAPAATTDGSSVDGEGAH